MGDRTIIKTGPYPKGFRFNPTDDELIVHYLFYKVYDEELLPPNVVSECNLYENEETWQKKFDETGEKTLYFFTQLKKKTEKGSRIERSAGQSGTWKCQKDHKIYLPLQDDDGRKHSSKKTHIGSMRKFSFVPNSKTNNEYGWVMHEYRLDGVYCPKTQQQQHKQRQSDWVLCRVNRQKNKHYSKATGEENGTITTNIVDAVPNPENSIMCATGQAMMAETKNTQHMGPSGSRNPITQNCFINEAVPLTNVPPLKQQATATSSTALSTSDLVGTEQLGIQGQVDVSSTIFSPFSCSSTFVRPDNEVIFNEFDAIWSTPDWFP